MPLDRFIHFPEGKKPSGEEILQVEKAIKEYGKHIFMMVELREDRFFVNIPGRIEIYDEIRPRWIEVVVLSGKSIDVLTRNMDNITNDIAEGLAKYLARKFRGTLEE